MTERKAESTKVMSTSKTELMDIGKHCSFCGQIDFLPFTCSCKAVFCREHRLPEAHSCQFMKKDPSLEERSKISTDHLPPASSLFPKRNSKIELKTTVNNPVTIKGKLEKSNKTDVMDRVKAMFTASQRNKNKTGTTAKRSDGPKLKLQAKGDSKVTESQRIYVWIHVIDKESKLDKNHKQNMFISKSWPIGRALDSISSILNLSNINNRTTDPAKQLSLFKTDKEGTKSKLNLSERCTTLNDGDTLYLVRGNELV